MNQPSLLTRLMASRFIALVLLFACGAVIVEWLAGGASWWLGIIALLVAMQTLSAVGKVSRYKAWSVEWQAMGEPIDAPAARLAQKPRRKWVLRTITALLFAGIPAYLPEIQDGDPLLTALTALWMAVCLYLAFKVMRGLARRMMKRRTVKAEVAKARADAAPVAWPLDRASSSPSRAEAERNLPEYCARLLERG
jgi:hypothetical protein